MDIENIKYTRKQYLNKECTHREYYAQFVTPSIKYMVKSNIGLQRILNSECNHFNDIPLKEWDKIPLTYVYNEINRAIKNAGDYLTTAGCVCLHKEAARQIKEKFRD